MAQKTISINRHFQEVTEHRLGTLPIQYYVTSFDTLVNGRLPLHWHDEMQWVVMLEGEAEFSINHEVWTIKQGEALFINSGRLHAARHMALSSRYLCINAAPSFLMPEILHDAYLTPFVTATNFSWLPISSSTFHGQTIIERLLFIQTLLTNTSYHFELGVFTALNDVWRQMIGNEPSLTYQAAKEREEQTIKQMLEWIHVHYAETIRLEDIARAGSLSRSECCRYFQRILKTTPMRYVKDYRIQKSVELLQSSDASITDIAFQVGFSNASHFIETFRHRLHTTPLAYQKKRYL